MFAVERVAYLGWPNCYRLSTDQIDVIVTTDVGPRIIRFGFVGLENEFAEMADQIGRTSESEWINFGGHRLWHAPEAFPRTYAPDSRPLRLEEHETFVRAVQETEPNTGIQKEMDIRLSMRQAKVEVIHRLRNQGVWPVELAPWALSVMAPGGVAILPLPPRGSHPQDLAPSSRVVLWPYTDMSDSRWTWGRHHVLLRQASTGLPQKAGVSHAPWIAYARGGHLFVKRFALDPAGVYPDLGCSVEAFTNTRMLEVESLAPLSTLAPGQAVEYVETWTLFQDVPMPTNDADVARDILPLVD